MANVAQKYAQALYDVTLSHNILSEVYDEFTEINTAVESQIDYLKGIDYEPKITIADRRHIVDNVFAGTQPYLMNTLKIVAGHRNLHLILLFSKHLKRSIINSTVWQMLMLNQLQL
ncbi:F0F1 ATP synthase subunit delta [Staphylococcus pseudintermedius]|nr:F0F1 ATP synthase subunit delta [Staphylococcus pseudintermedius]